MTPYETATAIAEASILKKNFIAPKGFTLSYAKYRVLRPLLKLNYKAFKLFNKVTPWTTQASIKTFDQILTRDMVGFEYGSGFSTLYFARRMKHVTSIEHNPVWFNLVNEKFKTLGVKNVSYQLIPPGQSNLAPYPFYEKFQLTNDDFQVREEYIDYFSAILNYPDSHFDFILVDGRARVECCLLAIAKLKSGGIFVLDNSDRSRYRPVFHVLKNWKSVTTTTGLFDTTIWFKP